MAIVNFNFVSASLMRTVSVRAIIPIDKVGSVGNMIEKKPFKTLYLLHGFLGNDTDWISGTRIQRWAEERGLAVIMPAGENMFYVDQEDAHNYYGNFIGRELVEVTRRLFHLSEKREDTFIAGLSMGGYGAIRNGLKYNDTFSHIAGLSSAINVASRVKDVEYSFDSSAFVQSGRFMTAVFGDLEKFQGSDKDPFALAEKLAAEKKELPRMFVTCGDKDSLLTDNQQFAEHLKTLNYDVTYEEKPGAGHEWDFWDEKILRVLEWLPLQKEDSGLNSGNVGV